MITTARNGLFLALLLMPLAHSKTANEVYELAANSTVVVLAYEHEGHLKGLGSGVVMPSGAVATNCHVIEEAGPLSIRYREQQYPAETQYTDWDRDICTLIVTGLKAPSVRLGSTSDLLVGSRAYAVGAPQGLELSLSEGIVSSLRLVEGGHHIQTTAAISPGSSGGGLFDANGDLIGLTTYFVSDGQSLNFAVPVEWISELPERHATFEEAEAVFLVWLNEARALEEAGNWEALIELATEWSEELPNNAEAWLYLGIGLENGNNWYNDRDQVINAYHEAVRINPRHLEAWVKLGDFFISRRRHGEAVNPYLQATKINPTDALLWYKLGGAYRFDYQYDQTNEAIESTRKAVQIDPQFVRAWEQLAAISSGHSVGQLSAQQALKVWQEAVQFNPDSALVRYKLGEAYGGNDQHSMAIENLQRALQLRPDYSKAWSVIGHSYESVGRYSQAIEASKQALELNPDQWFPWYTIGSAQRKMGKTDELRAIYNQLEKMDPYMANMFFEEVLLR